MLMKYVVKSSEAFGYSGKAQLTLNADGETYACAFLTLRLL